jgi:hypothetical protein
MTVRGHLSERGGVSNLERLPQAAGAK